MTIFSSMKAENCDTSPILTVPKTGNESAANSRTFKTMLVFIIPLQSRQVSRSWAKVCRLFEICVRSACQQNSSQFRVIVVCHELPEIMFQNPHLNYIQIDFPIPDITSGTKQEIVNRKNTDKGRKILRGLIAARDFQPTHTMFLDADDCVSQRLAGFVAQHSQANGWFIRDGYRYQVSSSCIYKKSRDFHTMCGSSNILRYDLNRLPTHPEYNRGYGYYKFY
ncbi:MAG TPA: hypothetical protein V6D46_00705, partial [Coleofasciculaceae cyanobacterium]